MKHIITFILLAGLLLTFSCNKTFDSQLNNEENSITAKKKIVNDWLNLVLPGKTNESDRGKIQLLRQSMDLDGSWFEDVNSEVQMLVFPLKQDFLNRTSDLYKYFFLTYKKNNREIISFYVCNFFDETNKNAPIDNGVLSKIYKYEKNSLSGKMAFFDILGNFIKSHTYKDGELNKVKKASESSQNNELQLGREGCFDIYLDGIGYVGCHECGEFFSVGSSLYQLQCKGTSIKVVSLDDDTGGGGSGGGTGGGGSGGGSGMPAERGLSWVVFSEYGDDSWSLDASAFFTGNLSTGEFTSVTGYPPQCNGCMINNITFDLQSYSASLNTTNTFATYSLQGTLYRPFSIPSTLPISYTKTWSFFDVF